MLACIFYFISSQAVELCLRSGAKISTQQHDLSTPVHLACAQGAIDIVKLMFGLQPAEKMLSLASCDVQKMTPLHCAAMFDRVEIVQYLVQVVRNYLDSKLTVATIHNSIAILHRGLNMSYDLRWLNECCSKVFVVNGMNGNHELKKTCFYVADFPRIRRSSETHEYYGYKYTKDLTLTNLQIFSEYNTFWDI